MRKRLTDTEPLFRKVLIANRGEIAVRIARTLREMGIPSVAVYSDADAGAAHVEAADEAFPLGPPMPAQSYLNQDRIFEIAREAGVEAIHPGYGFLSENAAFARRCAAEGVVFIGPPPEAIEAMGSKIAARRAAKAAGVPIVPGTEDPLSDAGEIAAVASELGYPVAIKAAAGGGGYGMRVANAPEEVEATLEGVRRDAGRAFGDTTVYVEKFFSPAPRHIEIQVLGDRFGNVVHLGERECSLQRRFQKIVEETPSPAIGEELRQRMGEAAVALARHMGYQSAGTIECLVAADGEFYFLEMNTRLQVEHPVTEEVTGVDLVREMVRIAAGLPLSIPGAGDRATRPRHRGADLRRGSGAELHAVAGTDHPTRHSGAAEPARRHRRASGHERHGLLRPDDRQADRLGRGPGRRHPDDACRAGGNRRRGSEDQYPVLAAHLCER